MPFGSDYDISLLSSANICCNLPRGNVPVTVQESYNISNFVSESVLQGVTFANVAFVSNNFQLYTSQCGKVLVMVEAVCPRT